MDEKISTDDNFSKEESIEHCVNKSPIGAEPGFQSVAIEILQLLSNNFLIGAKGSPRPILHPGSITPLVSDLDKYSISSSLIISR